MSSFLFFYKQFLIQNNISQSTEERSTCKCVKRFGNLQKVIMFFFLDSLRFQKNRHF